MARTKSSGNKAKAFCLCAILLLAVASPTYADTVVRFQTPLGDFDVLLYDTATPITVANFLNYLDNQRYEDSFFHRLMPGFVLQGGGFTYDAGLGSVESFPAIQNEYDVSRSNLRGTIAMAKTDAGPDSATSQFFFNLADNSANLDNQNGGFTVFAEVIGNGMDVVDLLASQQVWDGSWIHGAFSDLPLINFSGSGPWEPTLEMFEVGFLPGDVDANGSVGDDDLDIIKANWGQTGLGRTGGDLNGNGIIDGTDYTEAISYWATSAFPPEPAPIPEPATIALLMVGGFTALFRRPE